MSELDHWQALFLGALQGLTEFLPVSSSGHLALAQRWLGLDPHSTSMLLFDVLAHVGTLLAVAIVFGRQFQRFVRRLARELGRPGKGQRRYACRIALLAGAATIPTAVIGLTFKAHFEAAFGKPAWIGTGLVLTGTLLAMLTRISRGKRGWKDFRWWQAVLVGVAQGIALLPGVSRSGLTICTAVFCGLRRRWAAEFSFLVAVPAILAATTLKLHDTWRLPPEELAATPWSCLAVGGIVSMIIGVLALRILLHAVHRAKLHYFSLYCWLLGGLILMGIL